ncbi:Aminotransferase class-V [Aspergillus parasiticus SU-1]|uniref:Aminotransferase class-V n=1 Tax=Aspergillus parasiticus (strain ATCC 56775 / NRRL 5862 / SRRC 143 / SU-1) TaxID=1403190 RepID=A0A0F0IKC2_ASPPU|nr:Aminotransferase class-V [Aspergillus parasiticus SU-1]
MKTQFGKPMREHFLFSSSWAPLAPSLSTSASACSKSKTSSKHLQTHLSAMTTADTFLNHAKLGIDTILRNLDYTTREHMDCFNTVYGAAERTMLHLAEKTGVNVTRIPLAYPLSDSEIVHRLYTTVAGIRDKGEDVKVVVFDTIAFEPGVRMPFENLIAACRKLGILSCVDGAHCVGQILIDLSDLEPDFFVSNLHK